MQARLRASFLLSEAHALEFWRQPQSCDVLWAQICHNAGTCHLSGTCHCLPTQACTGAPRPFPEQHRRRWTLQSICSLCLKRACSVTAAWRSAHPGGPHIGAGSANQEKGIPAAEKDRLGRFLQDSSIASWYDCRSLV